MFRLLWSLALLSLFVVIMLVNAPARLLARVLPADQVIMQGFTGTLWQGAASRCMIRLPAGFLHLGAVQWTLDPFSLLVFAPRVEVRSDWGNQNVAGSVVLKGRQDLIVENLEGRVAADLLRQFAPVAVGGNFNIQLNSLELRDGLPYSVDGRLVWQQGSWLSPRGPVSLGSYALDVKQPEGEALIGEVITLNGPLEARGEVFLEGRRYELDVLVIDNAGLSNELKNALSLMAEPSPDGYKIVFDGQF